MAALVQQILLGLGLVVFLWISFSDLIQRVISNRLILAATVICLLLCSLSPFPITSHLTSFIFASLLALPLFSFSLMAGGDAKLIMALSIALPAEILMHALFWMSVFGGLLSCIYLIKSRMFKFYSSTTQQGVPYGVAITSGFGLVITHLYT